MTGRYRWVILAVGYALSLVYGLVYQTFPPILGQVIPALQLSYAQAGSLMSLFSLPGILLSIPGGLLCDRYGARRISLMAFLLLIVGTAAAALAGSFALLALGRVASGVGAITLSIVAPRVVSQWFAERELGIAMGALSTAMPLGTILAFNILGPAAEAWGWRAATLTTTLAGAAVLAVFLVAYAPAPATGQDLHSVKEPGLLSGIRQAGVSIWLVGLAWMCYTGSAVSLFTFAPGFLMARGFDAAAAGFWTSFPMWGSLALSPIIGYLIARMGGKSLLIALGTASSALLTFLFPIVGTPLSLLFIALAVTQALVPAPVFSLPADVMQPRHLGLGFGILAVCANLGVLCLPYVVGWLIDITGSYSTGFALMGLTMLLGAPMIALLRLGHRSPKTGVI